MAAGNESWTKNSKQTLLLTMNLVAHEAATALQRCWRGRRRARESSRTLATAEAVSGYVAKAATHHGSFGRRRPRVEPSAPSPVADKTPTATRKSNPRPVQSRAVPVNPFQAMKLRMAQQQQEAEERRILGRQEAEEARQARAKPESAGARGQAFGAAPVLAAPAPTLVLPEAVDEDFMLTPPTALDTTMEALLANLAAPPLQSERDRQDMQDSTADSTPKLDGKSSDAGESMLTPLELRKLRAEASKAVPSESSPAKGSVAPSDHMPAAATERLRDRLRKRESAGKSEQRNAARPEVANTSQVNWKERIELRHKEAEEQQVQEKEEKQRTAERSSKRSDALRRVLAENKDIRKALVWRRIDGEVGAPSSRRSFVFLRSFRPVVGVIGSRFTSLHWSLIWP